MISTPNIKLIARASQMEILRNARTRLAKNQGTIVYIPAESGYGKTAFLRAFEEECSAQTTITTVIVDCQSPVGNFQVGNLQALHPFVRVLEDLTKRESKSAQKKLAFNIGMTVLTAIPFIGDVFYAVKEIGKDVKEFQKDTNGEKKIGKAVNEVHEILKNYALKSPLILLLDDMQWSDADSVDLLGHFAESLSNVPIMLVVSYRASVVQDRIAPLMSLIKQYPATSSNILKIELPAFLLSDVSNVCTLILSHYKQNRDFEHWLLEKTSGIPQIIVEYLHYFERISPFDASGNLTDEFKRGEIVPASVHAAFSKLVEQLSDEDRNVLSICSAEGNECTAFVVSKLMNTDVLTTIKKLRFLQQRTGIIRSNGAHTRYGIKTTVYQFGQSFYQEHFHELLEFEEKKAIHEQIASLLQKQFTDAVDDQTRNQIAPYLAAHNAESGNEVEAQKMLLITAQAAVDLGSSEVAEVAHQRMEEYYDHSKTEQPFFKEMKSIIQKLTHEIVSETDEVFSHSPDEVVDVEALQLEIVKFYHDGNFTEAIDKIETIFGDLPNNGEKAQLLVLLAKLKMEIGQPILAREVCMQALDILRGYPQNQTLCLVLNTLAIVAMYLGEYSVVGENLKQAATLSQDLTNEYKLLTLSNIAIALKKSNPQEASRYKKAAKKLSKSLHFSRFAEDAFVN